MDRSDVKKCKKTLNILKIAATDKENITSKYHKKKMNVNTAKTSVAKKNKKNVTLDNRVLARNTLTTPHIGTNIQKNKSIHPKSLEASDLVGDNPSENYWRNLAESCRTALDAALKENVDLHNKVTELEYENCNLKEMLKDAKSLVEVLTEMIEDKDEISEPLKDDGVPENITEDDSDSDFENSSFQSCIQ